MDAVSYVVQVMKPMSPRNTGWTPLCQRLHGIRVVLFDVYGTLVQSAAGDISLVSSNASVEGMKLAQECLGGSLQDVEDWIFRYREGIAQQQEVTRELGIDFPEVEIRKVWRMIADTFFPGSTSDKKLEQAALRYECAVNPTWEMPGAGEMIESLVSKGMPLGLISNAQFYTHFVLDAALSGLASAFEDELSVFSYQEKRGKPSIQLFETMKSRLEIRGVSPREVLYFGNDLRKDILPAREVGFRTGLFAGDQRSLRVGEKSETEVRTLCDVILTEWSQWRSVL